MWKARVLVLNASDRHALSIARALAKAGYYVCMGDSNRYSVGFLSRCCHERVVFPCEARQEEQVVPFLKRCLTDHRIDVILPVDYNWNVLLSKYAREFDGRAAFLAVDYEQMRIACTKDLTMRHAASIGLGVPKTYAHPDEIECFPIVVKHTLGTHAVRYINNRQELAAYPFDAARTLLQDYIPGDIYGFFGLYWHGEPQAFFMHHRLRQNPPSGGASAAAEAYYDEALIEYGDKLLRSLHWHGIAMVEVKKDQRDASYKLIEINPKFWGSFDLSRHAGVPFAEMYVQLALGQRPEKVFRFDTRARFRWLFSDDLLHVVSNPRVLPQWIRDFFDPHMASDLSWSDPLPTLYYIGLTPLQIINRLLRGRLFHPEGKIRGSGGPR